MSPCWNMFNSGEHDKRAVQIKTSTHCSAYHTTTLLLVYTAAYTITLHTLHLPKYSITLWVTVSHDACLLNCFSWLIIHSDSQETLISLK